MRSKRDFVLAVKREDQTESHPDDIGSTLHFPDLGLRKPSCIEEDVEEDWDQYASLFHAITDFRRLCCTSTGENLTSHNIIKQLKDHCKFLRASSSLKDCPQSLSVDGVESFYQVDEDRVEWHVFLNALFL